MGSQTSFLNKKLYAKDIKRFFPFVIFVLACILLLFVVPAYMRGSYGGAFYSTAILSFSTHPLVVGTVSLISALMVFSYLNQKKSAYMLHSFPVSRAGHFFSHYLSGLTFILMIAVSAYGCVLLLNLTSDGVTDWNKIPVMLCGSLIEIVFFYSMAVFVCMVCGNIVLSIVTFGVLNVLYIFVNIILEMINSMVITDTIVMDPGAVWDIEEGIFSAFFPVGYFAKYVSVYSPAFGVQDSGSLYGLGMAALMLIPAVCFIILAFILYRNRKIENTGEMVVFSWCRVVFRVIFTVCGASLVMALMLIMSVSTLSHDVVKNTITVILILIIGGAISFVISEMILNKTVHIFKRKMPVLQGIIPVAIMIILVSMAAGGLFTPAAVPGASDVTLITYSGWNDNYNKYVVTDPSAIEKALQYQSELLKDEKITADANEYFNSREVDGSWDMLVVDVYSGDSIIRKYTYPYRPESKEKIISSYMDIVNDPAYIETAVFGDEPDNMRVLSARFINRKDGGGIRWIKEGQLTAEYKNTDDGMISSIDYISDDLKDTDGVLIVEGLNMDELYMAVREDLREGRMLPCNIVNSGDFSISNPECFGVIEMSMSDLLQEEDNDLNDSYLIGKTNKEVRVAITSASIKTKELLRKYGAII